MIRPLLAAFCLALLCAGLLAGIVMAEDEGSPSSVYLAFDEETGELKEVTDTSGQRKHIASQEEIASGTSPAAPAAGETPGASYAIGAGVLLLLLVAVTWLKRKRA
jgi:hypothetical protein